MVTREIKVTAMSIGLSLVTGKRSLNQARLDDEISDET